MHATIAIDTTQAVYESVRAGSGLSVLPDYLVSQDLMKGRLIHVLPKWHLPSGGIYVVFPAARYRPAKVRAFMDMLIQKEKER
jgi:DNA-binding transcriptional LysR family regulator